MKIKTLETWGIESGYHAMRNPYMSHDKATPEADKKLARNLRDAGPEHRKHMRMMGATCDMEGIPRYLQMELSTYKIGTVMISSSTMHQIMNRELTPDDFEYDHNDVLQYFYLKFACIVINQLIRSYQASSDSEERKSLKLKVKQLLPEGFKGFLTFSANYEELRVLYRQRKNHPLPEWQVICRWIESLPESWMITKTSEKRFHGFDLIFKKTGEPFSYADLGWLSEEYDLYEDNILMFTPRINSDGKMVLEITYGDPMDDEENWIIEEIGLKKKDFEVRPK